MFRPRHHRIMVVKIKNGHKRRTQNRKEKSQKAYTAQRVYDINKKQPRSKKYTTDQVKKRKRRFTIRQKINK